MIECRPIQAFGPGAFGKGIQIRGRFAYIGKDFTRFCFGHNHDYRFGAGFLHDRPGNLFKFILQCSVNGEHDIVSRMMTGFCRYGRRQYVLE